jgi:hypothetical protein
MESSGKLRRVALVRTDVSEELSAYIIRVTRIGELGTKLAVTSNRPVVPSSPILVTLMMEALRSSETSVLTRATRRNFPEDTILHSHRRDILKCYIFSIFSSLLLLRQLQVYREENTCFYISCFILLCVTTDICFNKPVTNEDLCLMLRERYFRNTPFEKLHNIEYTCRN